MRMRTYPLRDSQWGLLVDDEYEYVLNTLEEVAEMIQKLQFAKKTQEQATVLAEVLKQAGDLPGVWADREYLSGADGNAITDDDLAALGITKDQLTAGITLLSDVMDFADSVAVAAADRRATINALRTEV